MQTPSTTTRLRAGLATLFIATLAVTACGSQDDAVPEDPTPTERPPAPTIGEEVTLGPDGVIGDEQDESEQDAELSTEPIGEFSGEETQSEHWPDFDDIFAVYPTDVRAAVHDGFERIVIEHYGSGDPSYLAHYTDEPMEPGIGTPVDTGDAAYLEVVVSGTTPQELVNQDDPRNVNPQEMLEHGAEITDLDTQATGTVVSFAPWEATSNYIIGLDEQRPFAVTILENPVRVVVDIQLDDTND